MRENATFFNARRRIRKPVAPSTRLQALRACQNPSVGAELAPNRRPYGECGFNCPDDAKSPSNSRRNNALSIVRKEKSKFQNEMDASIYLAESRHF
jgi:hypothetical protein